MNMELGSRAAYATGFRAPSINDLFFPGFGNPNLKPEEVKSWEVGVDQTLYDGRVNVGVTFFDSDFTNLIQFDSVSNAILNVGQAISRGVETEVNRSSNRESGCSAQAHLERNL